MRKYPRRTLLGGIGSTAAIAAAGCLSLTDDTDDSSDDDEEFEALLEYVPATFDKSITLSTVDLDRLETVDTPDGQPLGFAYAFGAAILQEWDEDVDVSKGVVVERMDDLETPLFVLELEDGSTITESDDDLSLESRTHDSGLEYEYDTDDGDAIAIVDDIAVVGESEAIVEDALDATAGEAETLLESRPAFDSGLEYFADADTTAITTDHDADDEITEEFGIDADDLEYLGFATTVLDAQTVEHTYGFALESESLVTDDLLAELESAFGETPVQHGSEISVEADGAVATASWTVDLEAQQRAMEHDTPSGLTLESENPDDVDGEYVEARFTHGDPTPVEQLTIELEGEVYDDEIWADGQETVGEDDTIRLEADRIEPNLKVTITHETPHFSSSYTTHLFGNFRFRFDHDPDTGTMTVEYEDDYAFDGDDLTLAVYDEEHPFGDDEPTRTATPWEGATLSAGDEATVDDIEPGMAVLVSWQGTTPDDSVARTTVNPPGRARIDYEYETETVRVEFAFEDDRSEPAANYELLLDDEPAPTQFTDVTETVSDGTAVTIDDVDVGTNVTVTWGGEELYVGGGNAAPRIELAADLEDGDLAITHEEGPALPVSDLEAQYWHETDHETIAFDSAAEGTFAAGDTVTLPDVDIESSVHSVSVRYDDAVVGSAALEE